MTRKNLERSIHSALVSYYMHLFPKLLLLQLFITLLSIASTELSIYFYNFLFYLIL